ncbi:MAG: hypothetical protein PHV32_07315 [Eubacteriales bacterium]|nr:hypothetical protein [Eubacteriales bacterium]
MTKVEFQITKEQARSFAFDIFDVLIRDIKAAGKDQETSDVVEQRYDEKKVA